MKEGETQLTIKDIQNKSIAELYRQIKIPKEVLLNISQSGDERINKFIENQYKLPFKNFNDDGEELLSQETEDFVQIKSLEIYRNLIDIISRYVDVEDIYKPIIALWIMGTYIHEHFRSYPFLYFNAMKGSGKSRMLNLITFLSKDGEILNHPTEAVLFRTKGALAIDEFEGVSRKGNENLRELLNSAYKRGAKVKRMKKVKTLQGEEQVVESFDVYRPIILANIWGMDNVLGDRCISVVLEKSDNKKITRLMELFDSDPLITLTKTLLNEFSVVKCNVVTLSEVYTGWQDYILNNYTTTGTNNYTKLHSLFQKIENSEINGRILELTMPLLIIAYILDDEVLDNLLDIINKIVEDRKIDDIYNNKDVALLDFLSQEPPREDYQNVTELTRRFKEFLGDAEEWVTSRFVGRSLERLKINKKRKRMASGSYVLIDYEKAQEKIKMFK